MKPVDQRSFLPCLLHTCPSAGATSQLISLFDGQVNVIRWQGGEWVAVIWYWDNVGILFTPGFFLLYCTV
jgi:hypothetical protein